MANAVIVVVFSSVTADQLKKKKKDQSTNKPWNKLPRTRIGGEDKNMGEGLEINLSNITIINHNHVCEIWKLKFA